MQAGIRLWSDGQIAGPCPTSNAAIQFLSIVYISRIPLYLAAGPSLEVLTDDDTTTEWLSDILLRDDRGGNPDETTLTPWWSDVGGQSEYGILLRVEEQSTNISDGKMTELLLYACAKGWLSTIPTPPPSSSPGLPSSTPNGDQVVKVFALPLNSNILRYPTQMSGLATPPVEASFLPYYSTQAHAEVQAPQKRQSLSSLFDDATQKRRKLKGRGGESISQAMANIESHSRGAPTQEVRKEESRAAVPSLKDQSTRKRLSRASTIASFPCSGDVASASHRALANGKRSSLHRVKSALSPRDSPALSDLDGGHSQQNKAALAKVIMAGMRLHGLQQRKRPVQDERPQTANSAVDQNDVNDEYKLVYHQVFKAATFALRRHLSERLVTQEVMREVVDQLLTLFCTDPTSKDLSGTNPAGYSFHEGEAIEAFDLPSHKFPISGDMGIVCSTPSTQKRHRNPQQVISEDQ